MNTENYTHKKRAKKSIDGFYLTSRAIFALISYCIIGAAFCVVLFYASYKEALSPIVPIIGVILLISAGVYLYLRLYKPYKNTEKMLYLFATGQSMSSTQGISVPYSQGMETAFDRLSEMINKKELMSATRKHAEFLALQNQINPHFLYNTLEGIRGEAIINGLDTIEKMTEALSTYFRYTISNVEHMVTIEEELANIENYFTIQKYRFGDRIHLSINCDERETLYKCLVPKLILQPVVENAIVHGIEKKIEDGHIEIEMILTGTRLIIVISDDGLGMSRESLEKLNRSLGEISLDYVNQNKKKSGGIALLNVNNRIRLLFGEEFGVNVYSTLDIGTNVEISVPKIFDEKEI